MNMRQILNIKDVVVLVFNGFYRDEKKTNKWDEEKHKVKEVFKSVECRKMLS